MSDFALIILEFIMAVTTAWITLRFCNTFLEKRKFNTQIALVLLVFVLCQWVFEHGLWNGTLWLILANFALMSLVTVVAFEKAGVKKLFLTMLLTVFWVLVELSVFFVMSMAQIDFEALDTIETIASKIVMIICVNIAALLWQKRDRRTLPLKYYLVLLFIPLGSLYIALNLYYSGWGDSFALMVMQGLLLIFNIIVFELYFQLGDYFFIEQEKAVFAQQIDSNSRYTEEQKKFRHDFQEEKHNLVNELIVFKNSLQDSGNTAALNSLSRIIENLGKSEEILSSGNEIIDALINYKYAKAKEAGVSFNLRVFVPDMLPIDQCDLGLLLGNALDNAIEAAAECSPDKRLVNINMNVKKEALVIVIENPYKEIKQDKNGALVTTKENRHHAHGYGLRSIIKVASKYDGEVLTEFDDNIFKLTMILNLPD